MNLKKKINLILISGILIYIILITIAMFTYAGGTWDDPNFPGYNFWGNTFSDLGRIISYNGSLNLISMILFSISYITISITFIPFYYAFSNYFNETRKARISVLIGSGFGFISSISFIGVVLTPADILRPPHMVFANLAYACIFFMGVFYSLALYMSDKFPKYLNSVSIIFSIFFFSMLMLEIVGLNLSRTFLVVAQKLGRFAIFIYFFFLAYETWIRNE